MVNIWSKAGAADFDTDSTHSRATTLSQQRPLASVCQVGHKLSETGLCRLPVYVVLCYLMAETAEDNENTWKCIAYTVLTETTEKLRGGWVWGARVGREYGRCEESVSDSNSQSLGF